MFVFLLFSWIYNHRQVVIISEDFIIHVKILYKDGQIVIHSIYVVYINHKSMYCNKVQ